MMYGTSIWELSDTSLSSCAPQSSFNEVHREITADLIDSGGNKSRCLHRYEQARCCFCCLVLVRKRAIKQAAASGRRVSVSTQQTRWGCCSWLMLCHYWFAQGKLPVLLKMLTTHGTSNNNWMWPHTPDSICYWEQTAFSLNKNICNMFYTASIIPHEKNKNKNTYI